MGEWQVKLELIECGIFIVTWWLFWFVLCLLIIGSCLEAIKDLYFSCDGDFS